MKMVHPDTDAPQLVVMRPWGDQPAGFAAPVAYADDHPKHPGRRVLVTRWEFTPEERRRIAGGEDLYIEHAGLPEPLQPITPLVGPVLYRRSAVITDAP